jgi:transposase
LVVERRALGVPLSQIGRELDVRPDQLRAWVRQQQQESGTGAGMPGETLEQENRRLRREVAVLRQEQAFAKKVAVYFAKESR